MLSDTENNTILNRLTEERKSLVNSITSYTIGSSERKKILYRIAKIDKKIEKLKILSTNSTITTQPKTTRKVSSKNTTPVTGGNVLSFSPYSKEERSENFSSILPKDQRDFTSPESRNPAYAVALKEAEERRQRKQTQKDWQTIHQKNYIRCTSMYQQVENLKKKAAHSTYQDRRNIEEEIGKVLKKIVRILNTIPRATLEEYDRNSKTKVAHLTGVLQKKSIKPILSEDIQKSNETNIEDVQEDKTGDIIKRLIKGFAIIFVIGFIIIIGTIVYFTMHKEGKNIHQLPSYENIDQSSYESSSMGAEGLGIDGIEGSQMETSYDNSDSDDDVDVSDEDYSDDEQLEDNMDELY